MKIGVLALQGDFREHIQVLRRLGVEACEVRLPADMDGLDGLIMPGGESTTIGKLAVQYDLVEPIRKMIAEKKPVWGTCAGMIILARDIGGLDQPLIGVMDIVVQRNAFGRQVDSFEAELSVPALASVTPPGKSPEPFTAVFIRAPVIRAVGPGVEVLATLDDGTIVAARQGTLLATAFHPELTDDLRWHQYFLTQVALPPAPRNGQDT
ncbi:MAG: pyridoxal 5'-phosphate synthase glutaminase subunit PdxT [Anaerolineae bacterium]|nr:pyridoxal 5'-phosphate synthase glutaminase subunit PdxT [Anaerolineae bacterium]